jgi:hypothetical protein
MREHIKKKAIQNERQVQDLNNKLKEKGILFKTFCVDYSFC